MKPEPAPRFSLTPVSDAVGSAPARRSRGRSIGFWVLIVVAGVLLLLSAFAVWVNRVASDTPSSRTRARVCSTTTRIRSAVATRAVDELFTSVDVQAELEAQLPQDWKSLSGVAAAGARQASYQVVDRALEQPAFQRLFAISSSRTPRSSRSRGRRIAGLDPGWRGDPRSPRDRPRDRGPHRHRRAGRGQDSADAGQIVVLRSDQLDTAQDAFQLLKTLAWVLHSGPRRFRGRRIPDRQAQSRSRRRGGRARRRCAGTRRCEPDRHYYRLARLGATPAGRERRVGHPDRADARLLPPADRRRDPLPRRLLARRPWTSSGRSRRASHLPSRVGSGRTSSWRSSPRSSS